MNVTLDNVTKLIRVSGEEKPLFDGLSLTVEAGERVAVLALPKAGKSTLIDIISGTQKPDSGSIERGMRVSWSIPRSDFAMGHSSVAWNIRSVGRLYGVKDREFVDRAIRLGGLGKFVNNPVEKNPVYVKSQMGFGVGLAMDFDLYLFDQAVVPGRKEFKEEAMGYFRERTEGKAILLATSALQSVSEDFDTVYVLERGQLTSFPSFDDGVEYFKAIQKAEAERKKVALEQGLTEEGRDPAQDDLQDQLDLAQAAAAELL